MTLVPRSFMGDLFDDLMDYPFGRSILNDKNWAFKGLSNYSMKTDIKEKDGNYELDIDLPGYSKENIKIELDNGYLSITASNSKEESEKDSDGNYIHKERYSGCCSRKFYVGEDLSHEDIKAQFSNGTLHLVFPKEQPKQIEQKKTIDISD